jgi:trafficking protein particle complex subunit 3
VTLTYGTIVAQLCNDYDSDYVEVNKQLDKMGYNIGMRLIEDFLAKSNTGRCANFRETAEMISKVGSEMKSIIASAVLTLLSFRSDSRSS